MSQLPVRLIAAVLVTALVLTGIALVVAGGGNS